MQTGFRFVEDHQFWWARCQESGGPEDIAKCAIRKFGCGERTQQSVLAELQVKTPIPILNVETAARERVFQRSGQRVIRPNLHNRLESCREIASVVMKHRRPGSDLAHSGR